MKTNQRTKNGNVDEAQEALSAMCLQTEVATTFTLLPTLATELRLNIFRRMTAVQDRLIQVHWSRDFNHPYAKAELVRALALNQESRAEVKKSYLPLFAAERFRDCATINPNTDICYIATTRLAHHGDLDILTYISEDVRMSLKHLAINVRVWIEYESRNLRQLLPFQNLEKLTVVIPVYPGNGRMPEPGEDEALISVSFGRMDEEIDCSRGRRRHAIDLIVEDAKKEFAKLAKNDEKWNIPVFEIKMLLNGGNILRDIDDYLASEDTDDRIWDPEEGYDGSHY